VLGGVCAGLAGHFGLNLKVTRLLAIIAFFMAMPFAVVAYLAVVFLVPAESNRRQSQRYEETGCSWGVRRSKRSARRRARRESRDFEGRVQPTAPAPSFRDVRQRYQSLDRRLAELEKEVTSPRFQLEQEFRKL
ncbi:MAG: PspC domain-containing protein, partial [Woeseiaceae bacterium]